MTSAVTGSPRALAQRSTSTVSAVETWQTCSRERVSSASCTSRATIRPRPRPASRAARAGRRCRPRGSRRRHRPAGVLGVLGDARRRRPGRTPAPGASAGRRPRSARRRRTPGPGAGPGHQPSSASSVAGQALAHRAHRDHLGGPARRPRAARCSAASAVSVTGEVLAMASTAVYPPRAAARVPEPTVSASSRPGSRRWVCRSTSPGRATSPSAAIARCRARRPPGRRTGRPGSAGRRGPRRPGRRR